MVSRPKFQEFSRIFVFLTGRILDFFHVSEENRLVFVPAGGFAESFRSDPTSQIIGHPETATPDRCMTVT